MIQRVVIYTGHKIRGPFSGSVKKQVEMFQLLPWKIEKVRGEKLVENLKKYPFSNTLLVIPAGKSTDYDEAFTEKQKRFLREKFFAKGGLGTGDCGCAYWLSQSRQFFNKKKIGQIPLFDGESIGPLYATSPSTYSCAAVQISYGEKQVSVFSNGGGYFVPNNRSTQPIRVLARYTKEQFIASIAVKVGEGAVLLSMVHPDDGLPDINALERLFPKTAWREIQRRLNPKGDRIRYMRTMLRELQKFNEEKNKSLSIFLKRLLPVHIPENSVPERETPCDEYLVSPSSPSLEDRDDATSHETQYT